MRAFTGPLQQLGEFPEMVELAHKKKGLISITGCVDAQKPHMIYSFGGNQVSKLIITFSEQRARELYEDYRFFDPDVVFYPAKDILFYQADVRGNKLTADRITALKRMRDKEFVTMITTFDALMNTMAPPKTLWDNVIHLEPGYVIQLESIKKTLVRLGYEKEYQVSAQGQFAIRGEILDIYPLTEDMPLRIDLWDDEIDQISSFDVESQRTAEHLEAADIYPACEPVLTEQEKREGIARIRKEADEQAKKFRRDMKTEAAWHISSQVKELIESWEELSDFAGMDAYLSYFCKERNCLADYFCPDKTLVFIDELSRSTERGEQTENEFSGSMQQRLEMGYILPGQMKELFPEKEIIGKLNHFSCISLAALDAKSCGLMQNRTVNLQVQSISPYNNNMEFLFRDLQKYRKNKYRVILLSGSLTRARRLADDLAAEGLNSYYTENFEHEVLPGQIMVGYGKLRRGYEYPAIQFAVISDTDIFGAEKKKKKKHRNYDGEIIRDFNDLSVGDFVVHENHGLGIYRGIEQIEVDKIVRDYIKIEYSGGSNLYILASQLEQLQKYAGKESGEGGRPPKLNKLGGQEWIRTKTRVRGEVKQIAGDLVRLYAAREQSTGYVYGKDTVWQKEFEELFPFEETEDQLRAIEATKEDMESSKVMDRLICGDVGYGKTEIAIRAAFKAVQESKQVAYLAPTTILAEQIYNTFTQRMKDFPVKIELLCRFRSPAQQKKSISDLKKGQVDIMIGTHRLLSKDVQFKDLGLLIVDEEQRFGVAHKEKIKQMKTNVDVLTLTATPIPRTLHMSLIGIRDMSVLEEPPMDRLPIQTYVMEYNEEMVREAINRELARDGQVYYVYNQVRTIADITAKIQSLVPDASVAFAHGQMQERELEKIMYAFINGEIDVLVSTTIIETGLDISNVNTMIIHDADKMGLSQLYQLRGRVGRSNRTAYAFLMYKKDKVLREVAEKRLAAMREYSELGSGFKVAMRDLELRGAGNLLGAEQSGHIEAVGYDLYCKMLHEEIREAKGEIHAEERFDTSIDIKTDAFIPASYIANEALKLDTYRRISGIESLKERDDMIDELVERFGEPPGPVHNLLRIACLKAKAHQVYIQEILQQGDTLKLSFFEKAKLDPAKLPAMVQKYSPALKLVLTEGTPFLRYNLKANSREKKKDLLEVLESLLNDMEKLILQEKSCEMSD